MDVAYGSEGARSPFPTDGPALARRSILALACLFLNAAAQAEDLDLARGVIVSFPQPGRVEAKALAMLREEVWRRNQINWAIQFSPPDDGRPAILVGLGSEFQNSTLGRGLLAAIPAPAGAEGFRLAVQPGPPPLVMVAGNDPRGVLYGVGRLLTSAPASG